MLSRLFLILIFLLSDQVISLFGMEQTAQEEDYYQILGVPTNATSGEIKKAYMRLVLIYHPDKPTGNEKKFKQIDRAYKTLIDPEKRKEYEQTRKLDPRVEAEYDNLTNEFDSLIDTAITRADMATARNNYPNFMSKVSQFINNYQLSTIPKYNDFWLEVQGFNALLNNRAIPETVKQKIQTLKKEVEEVIQKTRQDTENDAEARAIVTESRLRDIIATFDLLDQSLRERELDELLEIRKAALAEGKNDLANQITDHGIDLIQNQWGQKFPVNPSYVQKLQQTTPQTTSQQTQIPVTSSTPTTPTMGPVPQNVLKQVDEILNNADSMPSIDDAWRPYGEAIRLLYDYIPSSASKMLDIHMKTLNRYQKEQPPFYKEHINDELVQANRTIHATQFKIQQSNVQLPKFEQKLKEFRALERALKGQTGTVASDMGTLTNQLKSLEQQLRKLQQQLMRMKR